MNYSFKIIVWFGSFFTPKLAMAICFLFRDERLWPSKWASNYEDLWRSGHGTGIYVLNIPKGLVSIPPFSCYFLWNVFHNVLNSATSIRSHLPSRNTCKVAKQTLLACFHLAFILCWHTHTIVCILHFTCFILVPS